MTPRRLVVLAVLAAAGVVLTVGCSNDYAGGDVGEKVFSLVSLPPGASVVSRRTDPDGYFVVVATGDPAGIRPPAGFVAATDRYKKADCPTPGSTPPVTSLRECPGPTLASFDGPNPDDASKQCSIAVARPTDTKVAPVPPDTFIVHAVCLGVR